jgi:hypothetical protein
VSIIIHNTRFSRTLISIIPRQNANPKRVKKITFWVGKKKGREEEDDDDDERMLDEFPPHSPLFANSLLRRVSTTKIPEAKSDQEKKKERIQHTTRSSTM